MLTNKGTNLIHVPASIRLTDGAILVGTVNCGITGKLENVLSLDNSFVEFTSRDGHQRFITRHQIASIEPMETVKVSTLHAANVGVSDPLATLGLFGEVTLEQAKDAFHRLSKMYHPDKYSGEDMPREIARYASEKFREINAAYTIVRGELQKAEAAKASQQVQEAAAAPATRPFNKPLFGQG